MRGRSPRSGTECLDCLLRCVCFFGVSACAEARPRSQAVVLLERANGSLLRLLDDLLTLNANADVAAVALQEAEQRRDQQRVKSEVRTAARFESLAVGIAGVLCVGCA